MKNFPIYFLISLLFPYTNTLFAAIGVEITAPQSDFLLYESIEVQVKIQNATAQTYRFTSSPGKKSWLDLHVTSRNDNEIDPTSVSWTPPSLSVSGGEVKSIPVNLTPLFMIREPGEYYVSAQIHVGDEEFFSRPLKIFVTRGQPLWQQKYTAAADPKDPEKKQRPRTYSLIIHALPDNQLLYVRIMDPTTGTVYCTTSLGSVVNYQDPLTRIDVNGDFHVLHQSGTRIYTYSQFDPAGKLIKNRFFSNLGSTPNLVADGKGETEVIGGEEIFRSKDGMMELVPTAPKMQVPHIDPELLPVQIQDPEKKKD